MLMRLQMKMTKPQPAVMTAKASVCIDVLFTAAVLIAVPLYAGAARSAAEQQRWIEKNGILKCTDPDGKVQLTFKKGVPTYESEIAPIPADYRSVTFLVLDKGQSAVVFDYNNGGTTVTFYIDGCAPIQTHNYPKLEVYRYVHVLKSGAGIVAALSDINVDLYVGFDYSGYIIQWDSSGTERMKLGPFEIIAMYTQDIEMFRGDRYGALYIKGAGYLFLNFVKATHYLYPWPQDGRGGKYEITSDGAVQIFQIASWKTKEGKIIPNDGTLKRLPPDELDKVLKNIEPVYQLVHEHQL